MPGIFDVGCCSRWASCCAHSLTLSLLRRRFRLLGVVLFADQQLLDQLNLAGATRGDKCESTDNPEQTLLIMERTAECSLGPVPVHAPFDSANFQQNSQSLAQDSNAISYSHQHVELGRQLVERVAGSLLRARSVTEQATLTVGHHVSQLFETARRDNDLAGRTLEGMLGSAGDRHESKDGLAAIVAEQRCVIDRFVSETKACFARQVEFSNSAVTACREMERCVAAIEKLVFSSEILAFNVQVESIRLGEQGRAFSVLGEEMVRFSTQVSQANAAMQKSLDSVCETMQRLHSESSSVDVKLNDFAGSLSKRMQGVQERTENLTSTLNETLQLITSSNEVLMSHSQSALSELQFQDPLAQDLLRAHHEIQKIQELLTSGNCEDTSLADIDPAVGNDGRIYREAGEVELF